METQTRLSRHYKFISAENIITILSVSSDDYLHASLEVAEQQYIWRDGGYGNILRRNKSIMTT